nr:ABC transporter family substrate-binding protein [Jatrophihabitantaceae bacterium]
MLTSIAVLAAAGCSSDSKPSTKGSSTASALVANAQGINKQARDKVKPGGTVTEAIQQWITQYNPYQVDGLQGDGYWLATLVLPALWNQDATGVPQRNPDVLTSAAVTASSPKQVVTYAINPKATWSDGTAITWADFAQQWKSVDGSNSAYLISNPSGYNQISDVSKGSDDRHVVVTFSKPYADWQRLFDPLVPASQIDTPQKFNKGWIKQVPVTGGPWKFGKLDQTAQSITLVPDPKYWGTKPKLAKFVARAIPSNLTATDAFLNNEIDVTSARKPPDYKRLAKAPNTSIRIGSRWDQTNLAFSNRGILADQAVRQAIQHAVNRPAVVKVASTGLPYTPPILDNHFYMPTQAGYQDTSSGYGNFDVAAAKKLLDDDGWQDHGAGKARTKNGQSLKLSYVVADSGTTDVAEIIQSMLAQVGIDVAIQKVPGNDYFEKYVNVGKFDLTVFRQIDQVFASQTIPEYQQPQGTNVFGNFGRIGSAEIDDLMNQAAAETDPGRSRALYNQADAKIWALAITLPLFETPSIYAVRTDLANEGAWGLADTNQNVDTGWVQ